MERNSTDELDNNDDTDSIIDIQNIYNTRGPGLYRFTYYFFSDNNVCDDQTSVLFITLEKQRIQYVHTIQLSCHGRRYPVKHPAS
jgi:hypothetical protein